jgi:hypothetical protein
MGGLAPRTRPRPPLGGSAFEASPVAAGHEGWRRVLTDSVKKVARKSRVRNNRIKKRRHSIQRCASGWFFESKLRRQPLQIFLQHYRSTSEVVFALQHPGISLRRCGPLAAGRSRSAEQRAKPRTRYCSPNRVRQAHVLLRRSAQSAVSTAEAEIAAGKPA